jgi:hypothetical protein
LLSGQQQLKFTGNTTFRSARDLVPMSNKRFLFMKGGEDFYRALYYYENRVV